MKTIRIFIFSVMAALAGITASCTDYQDEVNSLDRRVTRLENLVDTINTNLAGLQKIVDAMDNGDYITNVTKTDKGTVITFAKAGAVTILDGERGNDATPPTITVEQDPTDGNYYWKILDPDGTWKWLTADDGSRVYANGKDAVSPKVRISADGYWEISVDGGPYVKTNTPVHGENGRSWDPMIINVESDSEAGVVYITTANQRYTIPMNQMVYATSIEIQGALNHQMAVTKGQVYQLNAKVLPNNASSNEVLWYIYEWKTPNDTKAGAVSLSLDGRLQCYDVCTFTVRCVPRVAKKESGLYDWVTINVVE